MLVELALWGIAIVLTLISAKLLYERLTPSHEWRDCDICEEEQYCNPLPETQKWICADCAREHFKYDGEV